MNGPFSVGWRYRELIMLVKLKWRRKKKEVNGFVKVTDNLCTLNTVSLVKGCTVQIIYQIYASINP